MTTTKEPPLHVVRAFAQEHDLGEQLERPEVRYLPFMAVFGSTIAVLAHVAKDRDLGRQRSPLEFAEGALATFYLTRVIAKEKVGAPVRAPFVEPAPGADPMAAKGDEKQPAGSGLRRSVGELVTCTRCLGPWAAAAVTFGALVAPRQARSVTRVLALAGANSFAHAAHAALTESANRS